MALEPAKSYTINDIYALPDGKRAELIDGVIYDMAPPGRIHQKISQHVSADIRDYLRDKGGECEVYSAPFAVFLNCDDVNYVEPDISVICDPNKLDDRGCNGAPDWIIEIVSPGSRRIDYMIKLFKYRSAGVKIYWVVDPDKGNVRVFDFEYNDTADYSFETRIPVRIYEGLLIRISDYI